MQPDQWLPLTEYALRSGMSISTLRRKIKSNTIDYRMEEGRYLIRSEESPESDEMSAPVMSFSSSDAPRKIAAAPAPEIFVAPTPIPAPAVPAPKVALPNIAEFQDELKKVQMELRQNRDESSLCWRALEARVAGIATRLDSFSEQMAEVKMLVKIFEEKLDERA